MVALESHIYKLTSGEVKLNRCQARVYPAGTMPDNVTTRSYYLVFTMISALCDDVCFVFSIVFKAFNSLLENRDCRPAAKCNHHDR